MEDNVDEIFGTELAFYEEQRDALVRDHPEKFVLIKGRKIYGIFDKEPDALNKGIELFGLDCFFVRQIFPEELVGRMPAYHLGLIHAKL